MRHGRHTAQIVERRERLGFKSRLRPPGFADRFADALTLYLGTVWFMAGNVVLFVAWMVVNLGWVPGLRPFDPFPFSLLTMAVSLEAIVLSIVVLVSQNFQSRIAELRAELEFEVDVRSEREITKLIGMVRQLQEHLGMECRDPEVHDMERRTDLDQIQSAIEAQNGRGNQVT